MAKITINVDDDTIQSYLDHYSECVGREIQLKDLSKKQLNGVLESLGDEMKGELEMRVRCETTWRSGNGSGDPDSPCC